MEVFKLIMLVALALMGNNLFLTRLPFSYKEADRVVAEAISEDVWTQVGTLNETPATTRRPPAVYRSAEKTVELYDKQYRAIVVHSSAHDKRRLKRLKRQINSSEKTLNKVLAEEVKREYFCRADAEAAARRLQKADSDLHAVQTAVVKKVRYAPGRPPKNGKRKIASTRYMVEARPTEKTEPIERKRAESGCFVLLTNVPIDGDKAQTGKELLHAYKEQHGIERNFGFLKDPLIVNDLFLKKPERIEALGAILLTCLLVWNLIEHVLRQHIATHHTTLPGWDGKQTTRPTAFMMSTKFTGLQCAKLGANRCLTDPLSEEQKLYLDALGLTEEELLSPCSTPR